MMSCSSAYSNVATVSAMPWWGSPSASRSSSRLFTTTVVIPASCAAARARVMRTSSLAESAIANSIPGIPPAKASSTALRPRMTSRLVVPSRSADFLARAALREAGCPGRSLALGVGPLPERPRLRFPPEPPVCFFFDLRTAPCRDELPATLIS